MILKRLLKRLLLTIGALPAFLYALFHFGREVIQLVAWLSAQLGLSTGERELLLWATALAAIGFSLQLSLSLVVRLWPRKAPPEEQGAAEQGAPA